MNEPWKLSGTGHVIADGKVVCDGTTEETARRIVACVNACAGIPTEALESAATDKTHGCHIDLEDDQKPDATFEERSRFTHTAMTKDTNDRCVLVPKETLLQWADTLRRRQEDDAVSIDMVEYHMRQMAKSGGVTGEWP